MAYVEPPEGPNGISFCVSNPDWFDQLTGVIAGEKLKVTLEIDVKDSRSLIQTKPLPMDVGRSESGEEGKPEWVIRGHIVSMGGEEAAESEIASDDDEDGDEGYRAPEPKPLLDQPADGTKKRISTLRGDHKINRTNS